MDTNHPTIPVALDEGAFLPERADGGYELAPPPEWMKHCPTCGALIAKVAMP